jgi:hypothetical protein
MQMSISETAFLVSDQISILAGQAIDSTGGQDMY